MQKKFAIFGVCLMLTGCGTGLFPPIGTPNSATDSDGQMRPQARPGVVEAAVRTPPVTARTVEEFDTTTAEERQAAAAATGTAERSVGATIVSLGDPARPGFWIETPLVSSAGQGRVLYPGTGQSAQVELIPIDGPATAGSRMSLPAMRLVGAPLTGLVEVQVFSGG
ncbi:hypothetical protein [Marivita hallyeonensis]|uniref:D-galactarate dehydratase n=1 Tax=Marivita hallyeonensis TaxID=996342 RepID=A0A1M5RLY7_9RHOB|nr:hypothetical protein [Marivita hallyeonensis]SHH27058.1 hypothetical protein SAMN05443551_1803 [Marivita hallyeonensis]